MDQEIRFKEGLERLEEIVKKMEADEYELEELLDRFQEGIKLYKILESKLNNIEERIKEITKKDGNEPDEGIFEGKEGDS